MQFLRNYLKCCNHTPGVKLRISSNESIIYDFVSGFSENVTTEAEALQGAMWWSRGRAGATPPRTIFRVDDCNDDVHVVDTSAVPVVRSCECPSVKQLLGD